MFVVVIRFGNMAYNTGIGACLLRFIGNELDSLRPWGYFGKGQNTKSLLVEVFSVAQ